MDQDAQIGRFGTISLLKKTPGDNTVITSFGVDTEELTFGRDPQCSVRLYYPDVSPIHCKIVFQERKAFLVVQGVTGVLIDGCEVYPPKTVPLANNSVFEIRKKRFQFIYPPKELRAQLFATPPRSQGRALRLSMIHTAEVFSPRPSHDPRENLRVLQSPLKPRAPQGEYAGNNIPPIILVDGNHPRVVEEDRDLVILEDVQVSSPQLQPEPPRRARSTSRHSLHRAVLIRSAQRAILQQEEEELEELEVLDVVAESMPGLQARANTRYSDEDEDQEMDLDEDGLSDEDDESEDQNTDTAAQQKSTWRKSLERIWPFRSSSQTPVEVSDNEEAGGDVFPSSSEPEDDPTPRKPQPQRTPPDSDEEAELHSESMPAPETPVRRALGSFMTPQIQPNTFVGSKRYSIGGGEPQRVPIEENKWRVQDIVVPLKSPAKADKLKTSSPALKSMPVGRLIIDDAERKAIQERRRSAVRTGDPFFAGAAPGMSPSKPRGSISPTKKNVPIPPSLREEEEEEMDTRSLLEKMKETVEGMKRRRTSVFGSAGTSLLAAGPSPERPVAIGIDGPAETKDNEITTEDASAPQGGLSDDEPSSENDDGFSLLRPGFGITKVQDYELNPTAPVQAPQVDTTPSASQIREIIVLKGQPEQNPEVAEPEDVPMQDDVPEEKLATTEPPEATAASSDANLDVPADDVPVVPARRTTRKTTAEPESEERSANPTAARRARKPASEAKEIVPPIPRRTRKATVEPQEEEPVAPPPPPPRRSRKPTVEPQPEPAEESGAPARRGRKLVADPPEAPAVTPAPPRRGRKATVEPAESIPLPDIPAPAKRSGRRTPAESTTPAPRATAKTPKSAPAAVRRGTRAKPIEVEADEGVDDDDPLDTIDAGPAVKEEETDEPAAAPKRGRSAAKARTKTPDDTSKIPTRSRSARKMVVLDKEASTPAAQSDDEAPDEEVEKVRVSRSKKPATRGKLTKVKEEVGDGPKEIGRVTRTVARTRTKTS